MSSADVNTAKFEEMSVPELKAFLYDKGITCSTYKKNHLVKLCSLAAKLDLESIATPDDYEPMDERRRRINETDVLPPLTEIKGWSKDLQSMPLVETSDILIYCLNVCGWNNSRLTRYREDNGYQLFLADHIKDVYLHHCKGTEFLYIKADCIPETRQSEAPYTTWVIMHRSGYFKSGGCSCVADNGTCKHCVALLFALQQWSTRHTDRHTVTGTDVTCVWDKPRKTSQPLKIDDLESSLKKPRLQLEPSVINYKACRKKLLLSDKIIEKRVRKICKNAGAMALHTLSDSSDESENESSGNPPTMLELGSYCKDHGKDMTNELLKSHYDLDTINTLEVITRGQSNNPDWYLYRQGRITASNFSSILSFKFTDTTDNYIVKKIFSNANVQSEAMKFGKDHEPVARQLYFHNYKSTHKHAFLKECGLFIYSSKPFIGASPDAIVECKCCGEGLVEIKCSFTYKNEFPSIAANDDHYHLYTDDKNQIRLRRSSSWYVQIQGQLGVANMKWCDFVFYTRRGIVVDRIQFDKEFFDKIVEKCDNCFHKYVKHSLTL